MNGRLIQAAALAGIVAMTGCGERKPETPPVADAAKAQADAEAAAKAKAAADATVAAKEEEALKAGVEAVV